MDSPQDRTSFDQIRQLVSDQGARHWKGYALAFFFMGLIGLATALAAYLMKDVVNKIFVEKQADSIVFLALAVVAIYTTKGFSTYGQQVTLARISNAIVADIQRRLYDHMLALGMASFDERHSAEFIGRQSFIVASAGKSLNLIVTALGRDLVALIGLVTVMVIQDPVMAVIGLVAMPVAVLSLRSLVKRSRKVVHQEFGGAMVVMETIQETAKGIRTLKSFGLEAVFRERMQTAIASLERASNKLSMVGSRSAPLMETLGGFAVAGIILYGGYRVVMSGQSPGAFFSFITALLLAYEPAKRLARVHLELSASLVGVDMLYQFLALPAVEQPDPTTPALRVGAGQVQFDDVRFEYRSNEPVLQGLSFTAAAGKMTALVGPSGGGKSTVISLLQRFYDANGGRILIDGQEIQQVSRASLRASIGVVSQNIFLFKGSIKDNIALGRPGASEADIIAAAKAAFAHDFILSFQDGYESQVGEDGHHLSGGQRQRIAIARAVLKDAPILLLDEATSALDNESEVAVQRALDALCAEKTTIVIAHRLETIRKADTIFVIENGRVIESGDHSGLLEQKGRYYFFKQHDLV